VVEVYNNRNPSTKHVLVSTTSHRLFLT
jgi:hypothetical protein